MHRYKVHIYDFFLHEPFLCDVPSRIFYQMPYRTHYNSMFDYVQFSRDELDLFPWKICCTTNRCDQNWAFHSLAAQNLAVKIELRLMLLACHKKSYLICDEITNFGIFTQPIPNFFSKYKTETTQTGQRQLLENK